MLLILLNRGHRFVKIRDQKAKHEQPYRLAAWDRRLRAEPFLNASEEPATLARMGQGCLRPWPILWNVLILAPSLLW